MKNINCDEYNNNLCNITGQICDGCIISGLEEQVIQRLEVGL
jgi:hypothetical protein